MMTDDEFIQTFEHAELTREQWTHTAHLRMAWLYCRRAPTLDHALDRMRTGIPKLNAALGTAPQLYHDTVTIAFGTLVHRRATAPGAPSTWPGFQAVHPELFDRAAPILQRHYRPETLATDAARTAFVPPDRQPL